MCCFSRAIEQVSNTHIFARSAPGGAQYLVYELTLSARSELAMILPLPVPPRPREDAVRFINLEGYRDFFADLKRGFPEPVSRGYGPIAGGLQSQAAPAPLVVHDVGDFEASFVPTLDDFERLDDRFRLSRAVWDRLPGYRDFGFAVFKLKRGARTIHPMAFSFPRRDPATLYLPTVHIHDGQVHEAAHFDHALYVQLDPGLEQTFTRATWRGSSGPASAFMQRPGALQGVVDLERPAFLCQLYGTYLNQDVYV